MKIKRSAQKQMQKLPKDEALLLIQALMQYETKPQGYIKWLEGRRGYRIRIKNYRAIFEFEDQNNEMVILKLLKNAGAPKAPETNTEE